MKRSLRYSFLCLSSVFLLLLTREPAVAGELRGEVSVPRKKSSSAPRRYFKGPYRSGHSHESVQDGPQNVVVYLPDLTASRPSGQQPAVMRQVNERFVPHVLPIVKNTPVRFPNEDDYYHNVFSVVSGDRFDLGRYARGDKTSGPFDKPGVVVVRCEIHPRMKAYILVLETSVFTVPSSSGTFSFPDLPDGQHRIVAWHPSLGSWEGLAEIKDDGSTSITIAF